MLLAGAMSCSHEKEDKSAGEAATRKVGDGKAMVDTMTLRTSPMSMDIISNGRIRAREYADVYFRNAEVVSEVLVRNGQRVAKGQPLARLDLFRLNSDKARESAALSQADLEMRDVLIGQGYDPAMPESIPGEVMALARVRSGLEQAEAAYQTTLREIEEATLRAPFSGVVANVKVKAHSMAQQSEPFCRIVNDGAMGVEFPLLESELPLVKPGMEVEVTPFHGGMTHKGHVTEINPQVDDNGQVMVTAAVAGKEGLLDGMNVRVRSRQLLPERLSVPKGAVTLRSGRQVVFTLSDGKAMWNYVTTGIENLDSYEITEGLEPGMTVIVGGNENLAHESPVAVRK